MKSLKYIFILTAGLLAVTSCKDWLDEEPPHLLTDEALYVDASGFQSGLNGIYSQMRNEREASRFQSSDYWRDMLGLCGFVVSDHYMSSSTGGETAALLSNPASNLKPSQTAVSKLFNWYYVVINAANTIITQAEKPDIDWMLGNADHKNRIIGEALIARAWAYRALVAYWGAVPLKLDQTTGENVRTDFTRTPEEEIWRQMIADLTTAAEYVPWTPYLDGSMTRGVALHYLAETYMTLGKRMYDTGEMDKAGECYRQAERFASILIGIGGTVSAEDLAKYGQTDRRLMPDYNDMFKPANVDVKKGNTESLWTWQWAANTVGGGANMMRYAFVTYYTGSRRGFQGSYYYDNGNVTPFQSEARGGLGWNEVVASPRVMELYYKSSTTAPLPAKDNSDATKSFWSNFRYEDRGSDRAWRKYFLLDTSTDLINNREKVNPATGETWKTGDTLWISDISADASQRHLAMGMDYRYMTYSINRYIYPEKYAFCDPGRNLETDSHFNQMYLRLAETILLRAEARVFLNDLPGAMSDINMLRGRANALPMLSVDEFGATVQAQVDFVLDERSRELWGEEQRRFTLIRLGRSEYLWRRIKQYNTRDRDATTNSGADLRVTPYSMYFPIPQSAIDANLTLPMKQNPGYSGIPVDESPYPVTVAGQWNIPG